MCICAMQRCSQYLFIDYYFCLNGKPKNKNEFSIKQQPGGIVNTGKDRVSLCPLHNHRRPANVSSNKQQTVDQTAVVHIAQLERDSERVSQTDNNTFILIY